MRCSRSGSSTPPSDRDRSRDAPSVDMVHGGDRRLDHDLRAPAGDQLGGSAPTSSRARTSGS